MSGVGGLTKVEQQLLMSAAVHGLRPTTNLRRTNTARVVNQVLRWRGLTAEQINAGWRTEDCDPEHRAVYDVLVRMTWQECRDGAFRPPERPGPALFEGGGNWGVPGDPTRPACWPQYNSCRLTAAGERLAWLVWNTWKTRCCGKYLCESCLKSWCKAGGNDCTYCSRNHP